jgi:FtsZ-binding cell division protein ZapB
MSLTPMQKSQLERLLRIAAADAPAARERERELRAEQEALVLKERRAAARLGKLQMAIDEVTTELHALLDQQARHVRGRMYQDNESAKRGLHGMAERLRNALPELAAQKGFDANQVREMLEAFLEVGFPSLFREPDNVVALPLRRDHTDDNK